MFATRFFRTSLVALAALVAVGCDDDDNNGPGSEVGLEVVPAEISMSPDGIGRSTAVLTRKVGDVDEVTISATGMPAGMTVTFVPELLPDGSFSARINVATAATVTPGAYDLTIRAEATGVEPATHPLAVTVAAPGAGAFTIRSDATSVVVLSDAPATTNFTISRTAPFTGAVTFTALGLPPGLTATFTPNGTTGTTTAMRLEMQPGAEGGLRTIEVRATALGMPDEVSRISVVQYVTVDDAGTATFTLAVAPAALTVTRGGAEAVATLNVTPDAAFTETFDVRVLRAPLGMRVTVTPDDDVVGGALQVTVEADPDVVPGTYNLGLAVNSTQSFVYDEVALPVTVLAGP